MGKSLSPPASSGCANCVGINTSAPTATLDVNGDVNTASHVTIGDELNMLGDIIVDNAGNKVGIGTGSPVVSLDIHQRQDAIALPIGTTAEDPLLRSKE